MKTKPSEAIHYQVRKVLKGAEDEGYSSVVVIGLKGDGEVVVAGSHGSPQVLNLIEQGKTKIFELQE